MKKAARALRSDALLLRSVPVGEADLVITLLTEAHGRVSAVVRGGRKSVKRFGGALEPLHTIAVHLDDTGSELTVLREARVVRLRPGIERSLESLETAGSMLRWARHLCPPRVEEAAAWRTITGFLDHLDAGEASPRAALAIAAVKLLADVGYGLELGRCVICGRPCPEERRAAVDPSRGGIVCQACGGARVVLEPAARGKAIAAMAGETPSLDEASAAALLTLVEAALASHAAYERT